MNAKEATFENLDRYGNGDFFYGIDLTDDMQEKTGEVHYAATMLRYMREYRQTHDCKIVCVNKRKSLYRMER